MIETLRCKFYLIFTFQKIDQFSKNLVNYSVKYLTGLNIVISHYA